MAARRVASLVIAVCLSASLTGCSGAPDPTGDGDTSSKAGTETATTLSKSTLPTEVGTKWTTVRSDGSDIPIDFQIAGPWTLGAGADWSESESEIVDPTSVPGIEKFEDVTYVTKSAAAGNPDYYYPRRVTDEWVQGLGRIVVEGDAVTPEPAEVSNFWPLDLEVGKEYQVSDTDEFKSVATVLSRNSATVPAGTIENVYLVRFRYTLATSGDVLDSYYLFAGDAGMVAWLSELTGSEEEGFTAAKNVSLLASLPTK